MILSKNENYCNENTKGYDPVCDKDNCYEGRGNNFRYEVYEDEPYIINECGEIIDQKESVLRDTTVLLLNHLALSQHGKRKV